MPLEDRPVPRFAAEPPQQLAPKGEFKQKLTEEFLAAGLTIDDEIGKPGDVVFFPDRTWNGRTYQPAVSRTDSELDLFGLVSFRPPTGLTRRPTRTPNGRSTSATRSSVDGVARTVRSPQ